MRHIGEYAGLYWYSWLDVDMYFIFALAVALAVLFSFNAFLFLFKECSISFDIPCCVLFCI